MAERNDRHPVLQVEAGRRMLVISDIHAHLSRLDRVLEMGSFAPEDLLILLGDMIEAGPDSLGSLRRCMALCRGGNAVALSGNWEFRMAELMRSDVPEDQALLRKYTLSQSSSSLLSQMCREMGETLTPDTDMADLMPRVRARFAREIAFMAELPLTLDAGGYFFIHGGAPTMDAEQIARIPALDLLKNDAFAQQGHRFDRWMVTGHWPVSLYDTQIPRMTPHVFPESRIIAIDGGCGKKKESQLNLLMLRALSGEPGTWLYADEFPRVRALEEQMAGKDPVCLRWTCDMPVEILQESGDMATVRSLKTGRTLEIPRSDVFSWRGQTCCEDMCSYELPVSPGEELSLVSTCSRGIYAKKDGVVGWYRGKWRHAFRLTSPGGRTIMKPGKANRPENET